MAEDNSSAIYPVNDFSASKYKLDKEIFAEKERQAKAEKERVEKERQQEKERLEKERLEKERQQEKEKQQEKERLEKEKLEKEKQEKDQQEKQRIEKEKQEKEKQENENKMKKENKKEKQENEKSLKIVITGASSGIGEAAALEFGKSNNSLFLIGRSEKKLQSVVNKIQKNSPFCRVEYACADVGKQDDVEKVWSIASKFLGNVDVLIANAGVGKFGNLEDISVEDFDQSFQTNVKGVFLLIKKVLPGMKKQNSGNIIVTSSNLGLVGRAKASIYCATKFALQGMIESLRLELEAQKINVKACTINPGAVDTPWFTGRTDVDTSKMLQPMDVVNAMKLVLNQGKNSNIDKVVIKPTGF